MKNRYFKGEKLVISGKLTDDDVEVSDYRMAVRVIDSLKGHQLAELPLTLEDGTYFIDFDTKKYTGKLFLRFIAYNSDNDEFVVSNNDIPINIQ